MQIRKFLDVKQWLLLVVLLLAACTSATSTPSDDSRAQSATVVNVIDGDTIDVRLDGAVVRVRYIGMDTPEREEACFSEASAANAALVSGQTVRLEKDISETDRFGRLLRYVYVGDLFVNAALVEQGFAEAARFPPDTAFAALFDDLEAQARAAGVGCQPIG